ncbi:tetratricopeptide repeat protein [Actinoplanes sp. NEAU-A12]|uniref:Tetratricopeptide repeat protein n=1 Tax=Actinoplanes sandaracinus TaxID=3045177 RepID=A0ABT6X1W1_9ACTN|nr:tetratricopeptide repeat protein [Actinoplanes sandaracinus]MDI6105922.1 tetratricopeptide repeat protein [Actinoplanes sandaracinus]
MGADGHDERVGFAERDHFGVFLTLPGLGDRPKRTCVPPPMISRPTLLPLGELNEYEFESLTVEIAEEVDRHPQARRYGKRGQCQRGIDVVALVDRSTYVGYQCKRVNEFGPSDLRRAVEAFATNPPLAIRTLIIVVSCVVERTQVEQELRQLHERFPHLTFELRDGKAVSRSLRSVPAVVDAYFGPVYRHLFCTQSSDESETGREHAALRPRQLPAGVGDFAGRQHELEVLSRILPDAGSAAATWVIVGRGGVGKTTLAVESARSLEAAFPDGTLFADLHGGQATPKPPGEVLAGLMRGLGIPEEQLPTDDEARAAFFRTATHHKTVLIILDDAADERQVRPLIPTGVRCRVIVTSRSDLLGLSGATRIQLDSLESQASQDLLANIAGEQAQSAPSALTEVADLCGHLPLALRIAGNILAGHGWTIGYLRDQLRDERRRLARLCVGDLDVRASFSLSLRKFPAATRQLFRRLSLLPGPDFDLSMAALLVEASDATVERRLGELARLSLVDHVKADGRYQLHDLVRVFAHDLLTEHEDDDAVDRVTSRVFSDLVRRAETAGRALECETEATDPRGQRSALAWFDAYQQNLTAAVEMLLDMNAIADAAYATLWLRRYIEIRSQWSSLLPLLERGVRCSQNCGRSEIEMIFLSSTVEALKHLRQLDRALDTANRFVALANTAGEPILQAEAHNARGNVLQDMHHTTDALHDYEQALNLWRGNGSDANIGTALHNIACVYRDHGHYEQATKYYEQDLQRRRKVGDKWGEAWTLNSIGVVRKRAGDFPQSVDALRQAEHIYRDLGDHQRRGFALHDLGNTLMLMENHTEARQCFEEELAICRQRGDRKDEVDALAGIAMTHLITGDPVTALQMLEQCIALHLSMNDEDGAAESLMACAQAYSALDRPNDALNALDTVTAHYRERGDRFRLAKCLADVAEILDDTGRYEEAANVAREVDKLEQEMFEDVPGNAHIGAPDRLT